MSIKTTIKVNEGSTAGVKVTVYDTNSDVVVPSSMNWIMRDSLNTIVNTGTPSALSSETNIVFSPSDTLISSGEFKTNLERTLEIQARYTSSTLGANAVKRESFSFTLVNNPY